MCEAMTGPWGWVMMLLMGIFWLAVLGGLGWLLYRLARGWRSSAGDVAARDAQEILRERYARGDIDHATFERMRADLDRDAAS